MAFQGKGQRCKYEKLLEGKRENPIYRSNETIQPGN